MFRFKLIVDSGERTYGVACRFFGVDVSILCLGFLNDWKIVDLRIPCNYGVLCQVWFLILSIGRLADDSIYADSSNGLL